jgi:hypothetical protein
MRRRNGFNNDGTPRTTLKIMEDLSKKNKIESDYMYEDEIRYLENNILSCNVFKARRSEISFLKKC